LSNLSAGWNENFTQASSIDSNIFPLVWGNSSEFSFNNGLTVTSNGTTAGFMNKDQSVTDGTGYGTYSATFTMPTNQGAGAYICLWPSNNVWPGAEIDLAEQGNGGQPYLTVHWKGSDGGNAFNYQDFSADLSKPTTVSVDWEASGLTYRVDGTVVAQFNSGGSVPVPKDAADGGQNEAFGVGNYGTPGTSLTLQDMSYTPSGGSTAPASTTPAATTASTTAASTLPTASSTVASPIIALSSPAMQFVSNTAAGANSSVSISDPGLKDVYAAVMNSHNVAESSWIEVPLNSSGQGSYNFHFQNSGDYVVAVNDPATHTSAGVSSQVAILPTT
jgi:glycosyl hydrolase family 16